MNQFTRSALSLAAATTLVFGGIYVIDRYSGWRPFAGTIPTAEISGSVGAVSPIKNGKGHADNPSAALPGANDEVVAKKGIFRCEMNGKTMYTDAPCKGYPSTEVITTDSAGVRLVDPKEANQFRAQALSEKPLPDKPSTPVPSKVSSVRAQCDELEQYVKALDERARQPLSGQTQDRIKRERKETREKMFDLDCARA